MKIKERQVFHLGFLLLLLFPVAAAPTFNQFCLPFIIRRKRTRGRLLLTDKLLLLVILIGPAMEEKKELMSRVHEDVLYRFLFPFLVVILLVVRTQTHTRGKSGQGSARLETRLRKIECRAAAAAAADRMPTLPSRCII